MPTSSKPAGLLGKQTPRVEWITPRAADFSAGLDALDLADVAGRDSLKWQQYAVRKGMAKQPSGSWAAFEVGVEVSRQNGKNGCIEVVELGWMITEPGVSILHTAHEFQTAMESMDKLEALIRSHPLLENEILQVRHGNGKEMIKLRNGSIIRFRTRTKSGGRGFSVDRLVIDEAMIWSPASQAAIMPLLTTAKNPQIWYLGSAADADVHEYCGKWASLRARALAGDDPALIWMEWSAPDPPDDPVARAEWRQNRENWAYANPSLGLLISEQYIEDECAAFRKDIEKWEIERLSAGKWPREGLNHSPVIDPEAWNAMTNQFPALVGSIGLALDRSPDGSVWVLAAAQHTADSRVHVEIGYCRSATLRGAAAYVSKVVAAWDPCVLVIDRKSAAAAVVPLLAEDGIEPELTGAPQMAVACQGFLDDAGDGQLSHSGQGVLSDAVADATKRIMPQGDFAWDRTEGSVAPLVAVTLARWGLLTFGLDVAGPMVRPPMPVPESVSADVDVLTAAF
ncbi:MULTISPECIES: hypothetical protein [unclassified Gordonia (in: high G+C Gram-positive bacteria)]|uniref:hypothetical protein n=1 Tax=unclassified Gordonia (in: high G+C Gram-positive bacteria) TaxID=2657482 RepID=UPI0012E95E86|nr:MULTISPECIES: hypothetical protein [unclassified Gordonia (in: high G+C Gram-positive bacteria)]